MPAQERRVVLAQRRDELSCALGRVDPPAVLVDRHAVGEHACVAVERDQTRIQQADEDAVARVGVQHAATSGRAAYTAAWISDSEGIGPAPARRLPLRSTVQMSSTRARTPAKRGLMRKVSVPGMRALRWPEPVSTPSPVHTCSPSTRRCLRASTESSGVGMLGCSFLSWLASDAA